jgi:hypothetical protein
MSTADETYQSKYSEIEILLENLQKNLKKHNEVFKTDLGNWGYVGDLGHIQEVLSSLGDFVKLT